MMDLRKEAEARALKQEQNSSADSSNLSYSYRVQIKHARLALNEKDFLNSSSSSVNETPMVAQLAEIDYKWNGARARAKTNDFIIPRWVPDEEVSRCQSCNSEFDFVNRKHHCRHCGIVCCETCSPHKALLPHEFGYKDPVRVCTECNTKLLPHQQYLCTNIANHHRVNSIDVASTHCNFRRYCNLPFSITLGSEIRKAAYATHNLFSPQQLSAVRDHAIPLRLLVAAKGLAFITVLKGGFIFAPRIGTGLVIARLPDFHGGGWSAPTAIGLIGISWGAVIGADLTDYVIILNTDDAVSAFSGLGQVSLGVGMELALGPVGRSGSAALHLSDAGCAAAYSYSHSRGLLAGLTIDGSLLVSRQDLNYKFYGRPVTPADLLCGRVAPPRAAAPLYDALADAMSFLPGAQHIPVSYSNLAATQSSADAASNPFQLSSALESSLQAGVHDPYSSRGNPIHYSKVRTSYEGGYGTISPEQCNI